MAALVATVAMTGAATLATAAPPAGAGGHATPTAKDELNDSKILGIADAANGGEVEQGTFALNHAHADSVKSFATMMVKDHSKAQAKGRSIAKALGLVISTSDRSLKVQQDGADVMTKLEKSDSDEFDRTYLKAQIDEHEAVLKMIDGSLMPNATASAVRALLSDMRMHVEHHLSAAHAALDQLPK